MAFDQHANFAISAVTVAPSPALSGTSLTVTTGTGALFPAVPFNCTVYPATSAPISTNAEIVRVTNITGDVLTIVRAQEGSTAKAIAVGYAIANTITKLVFNDIENAMVQAISAAGGSASGGTIVFDNSPTVSFGRAGQTITASAAAGGGGAAISAGTQSQSTGTIIFSNSNGVSFGLNAGTLTASHNGITSQTVQPVAASASNGSFTFATLSFTNASNVTFGTSAGGIIFASVNPTVAQSTQPVAASASNGSFLFSTLGFSNANGVTFGTSAGSIVTASVGAGAAPGTISAGANSVALGQVVFSNSNNVSFGLNGSTVTASASNAQTTQPVAASASNGSFLFSTLGFSNGNGVTFGTSAGSIISASVATGLTSQSNQAVSNSAGSFTFQTLNFSNANNVTFGTSAGGIITASVAAQSVQPVNASAPNGSFNFSTIVFSNSNNVSWSTTAGNGIVASVTVASTQGSVVFGAVGSTNTGSQMIFSNSNNVSFGLNGSTITATATVSQSNQQMTLFATGNTTGSSSGTSNASSLIFRGSGAISVAITNGSIVFDAPSAAAGNVTFSAGANSAGLGSIVFSNLNGVSFGLNGSTITASVAAGGGNTNTYWVNTPIWQATQTANYAGNLSNIVSLMLPNALSFDFVRMIRSGVLLAATTTGATTGNTQFSCGYTRSHNFAIYSKGSGANSQSLQLYFSTQILEQYSNNVSAAANSTQFSYSNRYSFPCSSGTTGFTFDYSSSAASLNFGSASGSRLEGLREMDFKIATTLSAGMWWLMYGHSSASSSQFTSLGWRALYTYAMFGLSQATGSLRKMGDGAINSSVMPGYGVGSFTTAGGGSTTSLGFSNITSGASIWFPRYEFLVSN